MEKRLGMIRIHVESILKAIYGNTEYEAVGIRISKEDRKVLEITVSHPALPEWKQGQKLQRIEVKRKKVEDQDA